ncbi:MAG: hypothetical protein ACRDDZ_06355 [Marinifilaceae bacterium]
MREISILKERILQYLDFKGITKYECYQKTGITNGVFSQKNGLSEDNLLRFLSYYKEINHTWLLTGTGDMERVSSSSNNNTTINDTDVVLLLKEMLKDKELRIEELTEKVGSLKEKLKGLQEEKWHGRDARDATGADVG